MTHLKPSFAQQVEEAAKVRRKIYTDLNEHRLATCADQHFTLGAEFAAPIAREEGKRFS